MARIRTIKPEFWSDDKVVGLSFAARLLFIGLWNYADDEGYLWYEPERLKRQIFPDQQVDHIGLFKELVESEVLQQLTTTKGKTAIHIIHFLDHQKVQHPTPSKISHEVSGVLMNPHESSLLKGMEGNGREKERKGREWKESAVADSALEQEFQEIVEAWNKATALPRCQTLNKSRKAALSARLSEKFFRDNWREALSKISKSSFCLGEKGWKANFDWFISPNAVLKAMEGQYDRWSQAGKSSQPGFFDGLTEFVQEGNGNGTS